MTSRSIIIRILFILSFVSLASGMLVPLWSGYAKHIGGDLRTVGIALAIYSLGGAVFAVIFGRIEDSFWKTRHWHRLSYLLTLLFSICYFFVDASWQFYLVQLGLGISYGVRSPALSKIYQSYLKKRSALMGWAYYNGLVSLSLGLAAIAGSHLAHYYDYNAVFAAIAAVAGLAFVLSFFVSLSHKELAHAV